MGKLEEIVEAVEDGKFRECRGAVEYLISEVKRLKSAIEKHRTYLNQWVLGEFPDMEIDQIDKELYKALRKK